MRYSALQLTRIFVDVSSHKRGAMLKRVLPVTSAPISRPGWAIEVGCFPIAVEISSKPATVSI